MADKNIAEAISGLEVEMKNAVDGKFAELKAQMDALEKSAGRPVMNAADVVEDEYKSAFDGYLRTGQKNKVSEFKQMTAASPTDGGVTVPKVIFNSIQKQLVDISDMRSVARVLSVSSADFHLPVSTGGTTSVWVGETDVRPATNTSSVVQVAPAFGELIAAPVVSLQLIEDSQFDIAGFVASEVVTEYARAEGAAFLNGNGTKQPSGLLNVAFAVTADKAARAFGTVQYLTSSVAGGLTADDLIALVGSLKAGFRKNASWIMTKATKTAIRSLKDAYGQYLLVTSLVAGMPDTLLGYPITEMEDAPEIATGNNAAIFGDFQSAYTIADRVGVSTLYNPYLTPGFVTYQTRMRVGGCVTDTQAYKVLRIK